VKAVELSTRRKSFLDAICLRTTAQFAAELALTSGFEWFVDDAAGRVATSGVIVPALDRAGDPLGVAPVHWAVAAWWPGINDMDDQNRLDELREITFSASIATNALQWRLGVAEERRWARKVVELRGRFTVLVPQHWGGYYGIAPA
jgi:hypothetical protein